MAKNQFNTATLILFTGLPGSGKTFLSEELSAECGIPTLSSEQVRAKLLGIEIEEREIDFTPAEISSVYGILYYCADQILKNSNSIILDGVFRSKEIRKKFHDLASSHGANFDLRYIFCSHEIALERLNKRKKSGTTSPAGPSNLLKMKAEYEVPDEGGATFLENNSI